METPEYADMMARLVRRYGVRVGDADYVDLARMIEIRDEFDQAIRAAVRAQAARTSWATVALGLGVTRQAAFMRFRSPSEPAGSARASESA